MADGSEDLFDEEGRQMVRAGRPPSGLLVVSWGLVVTVLVVALVAWLAHAVFADTNPSPHLRCEPAAAPACIEFNLSH